MIEERMVHFPQSDDSAPFENSTLRSKDVGFGVFVWEYHSGGLARP